jgi:LPPG:FO 2-phospho-L-lactate transferase
MGRTVTALAGGIGAARFLRGLVRAIEPEALTVVANTGDDLLLHGLHVSPDLDTITYTLGGGVDADRGWGRDGDTYAVTAELRDRYGQPDWFILGDRDLATHLLRTRRLAEGHSLSDVTAEIARAWGLRFALLPMSDDPVATRVRLADGRDVHFQEWWVAERAAPAVVEVRLAGAEVARPAPGVLEAIREADAVILCPSNPVVSIGTILQIPGIRGALDGACVVGVSPIVAGRVVRGMADRLLPAVDSEVSASAVARGYAAFLDGWVIDHRDASLAPEIERLGTRVRVTETVMSTAEVAEALARETLDLARSLSR